MLTLSSGWHSGELDLEELTALLKGLIKAQQAEKPKKEVRCRQKRPFMASVKRNACQTLGGAHYPRWAGQMRNHSRAAHPCSI